MRRQGTRLQHRFNWLRFKFLRILNFHLMGIFFAAGISHHMKLWFDPWSDKQKFICGGKVSQRKVKRVTDLGKYSKKKLFSLYLKKLSDKVPRSVHSKKTFFFGKIRFETRGRRGTRLAFFQQGWVIVFLTGLIYLFGQSTTSWPPNCANPDCNVRPVFGAEGAKAWFFFFN